MDEEEGEDESMNVQILQSHWSYIVQKSHLRLMNRGLSLLSCQISSK